MNDSQLAFFSRLRAFFFKTSLDHEFDDELAAVAGISSKSSGCSNPFIAPQAEWPQTIRSGTPRIATAYSMLAETPTLTVLS